MTLLVSNGLCWQDLIELSKKRSKHTRSGPEPKSFGEIIQELRKKLYAFPWAIGVMLIICGSLWYSFTTGDEHNHIIEATSYFSFVVALVTVALLYCPSKRLDRKERERNKSIFSEVSCQTPKEFWLRFVGTFSAFALLCIHMRLVLDKESLAIGAVVLWSAYVISAWGLFNLRRWRFCRAASDKDASGRILDADAGEFATTIGLSSALIAVVAQFLAARPY